MKSKSLTGQLGEKIAAEYLSENGYKIVEKNYLRPWGEIDIVVRRKDGTLVFVEVKTMYEGPFLNPEDNLTSSKLKKLQRTAQLYVGGNAAKVYESRGWQIDLVAVLLLDKNSARKDYLTYLNNNCVINHLENI